MYDALAAKKIFEQSSYNHCFEQQVAVALDEKVVRPPIYLSLGTEHIPPCVFTAFFRAGLLMKDYYVFPQHRCHSYYLTFGGTPISLAFELCGDSRGCNSGMGGSASVSNTETANLIGHSGLLGDQVPIAVGCAHASQKPTIVILGDAAAEEDYVLGAMGFAATKNAPILFLCEDNNLSILTEKSVRRSWSIVDVAESLGIESKELRDRPCDIYEAACDFIRKPRPVFLNVLCQRHRWHAGSGIDNEPEWDSFKDLSKDMRRDFGTSYVDTIVNYHRRLTESLWKNVAYECSRNN
jgi:TPP-dependent pyruvate/acetoin dehydrogenase alpha subunit